jgi:hypothetical protein
MPIHKQSLKSSEKSVGKVMGAALRPMVTVN